MPTKIQGPFVIGPYIEEKEQPTMKPTMKEVTFKRLSDDAPFTMMADEIFDCISDDPEFIEKRIGEKPPLCMVAHKDLNDLQIHKSTCDFLIDKHWETAPPRFDRNDLSTLSHFNADEVIEQGSPEEDNNNGLVRNHRIWRSHRGSLDPEIHDCLEPVRAFACELLSAEDVEIRFRGIYAILPEADPTKRDLSLGGHIDGHNFDLGVTLYLADIPAEGGAFTIYPQEWGIWSKAEYKANKEELLKYFILAEEWVLPGAAGDAIFWEAAMPHMVPLNYIPGTYRPAVILDVWRKEL